MIGLLPGRQSFLDELSEIFGNQERYIAKDVSS
jgi:hypothetical protein